MLKDYSMRLNLAIPVIDVYAPITLSRTASPHKAVTLPYATSHYFLVKLDHERPLSVDTLLPCVNVPDLLNAVKFQQLSEGCVQSGQGLPRAIGPRGISAKVVACSLSGSDVDQPQHLLRLR